MDNKQLANKILTDYNRRMSEIHISVDTLLKKRFVRANIKSKLDFYVIGGNNEKPLARIKTDGGTLFIETEFKRVIKDSVVEEILPIKTRVTINGNIKMNRLLSILNKLIDNQLVAEQNKTKIESF